MMTKSREQIYDELLVLKAQQGDQDAFGRLVGRWQERLWHYAFKVTGSDAAAWDLIQETWFAVVKGIGRLADVAVFPSWVFRILHNKCMDWMRKRHRQAGLFETLARQAQGEGYNGWAPDDSLKRLQWAVGRLPPGRRALLALRYHEGFDIGQIAEILGVPEGTVKSRIHRTLSQLRQMMGSQRHV